MPLGLSPDVSHLANDTGGAHFQLGKGTDLAATFDQVVTELRSQYVLGFSPERFDDQTHKLDLRMRPKGLSARSSEELSRLSEMTRRLFALACALVAAVPLLAGARAPHAARSTSAALSVTLVYDLSVGVSSVPLAKDEGFKRIVQWVVAELKPADQLRVGLLTEGRRLTRPFESHELGTLWPDVITKASVPDAERFGASPLWDNLDAVVRAIAQDPGRRAILILTDGRSTGNHISVHTLIADATAFGVSIWPIPVRSVGSGTSRTATNAPLIRRTCFLKSRRRPAVDLRPSQIGRTCRAWKLPF